jgi:hypothetical protein
MHGMIQVDFPDWFMAMVKRAHEEILAETRQDVTEGRRCRHCGLVPPCECDRPGPDY